MPSICWLYNNCWKVTLPHENSYYKNEGVGGTFIGTTIQNSCSTKHSILHYRTILFGASLVQVNNFMVWTWYRYVLRTLYYSPTGILRNAPFILTYSPAKNCFFIIVCWGVKWCHLIGYSKKFRILRVRNLPGFFDQLESKYWISEFWKNGTVDREIKFLYLVPGTIPVPVPFAQTHVIRSQEKQNQWLQ